MDMGLSQYCRSYHNSGHMRNDQEYSRIDSARTYGNKYDPLIKVPVAVAITIMMILFSVTDLIGFKLVFSAFYGIEPVYAILIKAATVAFYVSLGGFRAVVRTDLPKFALFVLFVLLAVSVAALALILSMRDGISLTATAIARGIDWWNLFIMG